MLLGVAACGNKEVSSTNETTKPAPEESVDKGFTVGWVCYDYTNDFWAGVKKQFEKHASERGWNFLSSTCDKNVEKEIQAFENFIQADVDGIIVTVEDGANMIEVTKQATDAGIPVFAFYYPYEGVTGFKNNDDFSLGYETGLAAANYMNEKFADGSDPVEVVLFTWPYDQSLITRQEGMLKALEENCKVEWEIVAEQSPGLLEEGVSATETILQAHPDVDVILAQGSTPGLGAAEALSAAGYEGYDVAIFAADAAVAALSLIDEGKFMHSVITCGTSYMNCATIVENLDKCMRGEEYVTEDYAAYFAIDPSNVKEYIDSWN